MKQVILSSLLGISSYINASEPVQYGWNIPDTALNVGGYFDAVYDDNIEGNPYFDDIALLISYNNNKFSFLSEMEISHLTLDGKSNNSSDITMYVERFQLSYALDDEDEFTIGRFNSDVGYWNQTPISMLQDTTLAPHFIKHFFPKATTGLLYKKYDEDSTYSITVQNNRNIDLHSEGIRANRHLSVNYEKNSEDFSWRMAAGFYREIFGSKVRYGGLGFQYEYDDFLIQSEIFFQKNQNDKSSPYSAYIQPVWYYNNKQSVVLRLERYRDDILNENEGIALLGYTYRPSSHMALKGEYLYHTQSPLSRFVYSFSVMF